MEGEIALRVIIFAAVAAAAVLLEIFFPLHRTFGPAGTADFGHSAHSAQTTQTTQTTQTRRRPQNLLLFGFNSLLSRLIFPASAVGIALWAQEANVGLFNKYSWYGPGAMALQLLLLDLAIYAQHVAFHRFSFFWRWHEVHHLDQGFDLTTGLRFHPVEILFSLLYKALLIGALGASAMAVMLFEIVLNAMSILTHINAALTPKVEKILRTFLVTPSMHRIHHAPSSDMHHNYGFHLSIWDRLFGTYLKQRKHPSEAFGVGQKKDTPLWWAMLLHPFRELWPLANLGKKKKES